LYSEEKFKKINRRGEERSSTHFSLKFENQKKPKSKIYVFPGQKNSI